MISEELVLLETRISNGSRMTIVLILTLHCIPYIHIYVLDIVVRGWFLATCHVFIFLLSFAAFFAFVED